MENYFHFDLIPFISMLVFYFVCCWSNIYLFVLFLHTHILLCVFVCILHALIITISISICYSSKLFIHCVKPYDFFFIQILVIMTREKPSPHNDLRLFLSLNRPLLISPHVQHKLILPHNGIIMNSIMANLTFFSLE
jgi:hypothetical protein